MTAADIVALGAFLGTLAVGLCVALVRGMLRARPKALIQLRVESVQHMRIAAGMSNPNDEGDELFYRRKRAGAINAWVQRRLQRIRIVSGQRGVKVLMVLPVLAFLVAMLGVRIAPLPEWSGPLIMAGAPLCVVFMTYRFLINRFHNRFLNVFPDTLDLIIRAVRAGVPVGTAIRTAGDESAEPVAEQFRIMGDAMRLGLDLKDVLEDAVTRIEIADFSFFSVCLLLQRETGGQLGETLENLANIIRTRRDIRLKTRALTAEGRMASRIIAAVPPVIMIAMYMLDRQYIEVLLLTETGHKMLTLAAVLMFVGLFTIQKMSKLDTSR